MQHGLPSSPRSSAGGRLCAQRGVLHTPATGSGVPESMHEACERTNRMFTITQVLDDGFLYSFSDLVRDEYVNLTIHVTGKVPGKLYQDGQLLESSFYEFLGTVSYSSVLGARKTVPAFKRASPTPR